MRQLLRRTFIVGLTVLIMASMTLSVFAKPFSDVSSSSVGVAYRDAINYVTDNGIMNGTSSTTFAPNNAATRAAVVTVLYRLSGDNTTYTNASVFTDVSSSSYYYNAVGWGVANGIVSGLTSTTFGPNQSVSWQQMATFLYRFAGYMGMPQDADEDLTQAEDYSLLQSYARTPMSWVYGYGILTRASATAKIYPTAVTTRGNLALFLARYRRNVEGVVLTRDRFSFGNSASCLVSGAAANKRTLISDADWSQLTQFVQWYVTNYPNSGQNYNSIMTKLNYQRSQTWGGSCYGFSVATILDYIGKIDINGNCAINCGSLYEIPKPNLLGNAKNRTAYDNFGTSPVAISEVESKINMYQLTQSIPSVRAWSQRLDGDVGLRNVRDGLQHSGVGIFCYEYTYNGDGPNYHAVVAYGKPIPKLAGFTVKVYDNRWPSKECWLDITEYKGEWRGSMNVPLSDGTIRTEPIAACSFNTNFDVFEPIDYDGEGNVAATNASTTMAEYTVISVSGAKNFCITNNEGESFTFDGVRADGTLNVIGMDMTPLSDGISCDYSFLVESSESFICTSINPDEHIASFGVFGDAACGFAAADESNIAVENVSEIQIGTGEEVQLR